MARPTTASLDRRIAQLAVELARLELQPPDDFAVGDVVTFLKAFDGRSKQYHYAAIKSPKGWHLTGRLDPVTWNELWDFIHTQESTPPPVYYVSEVTELL